jgi:hypothetical protein
MRQNKLIDYFEGPILKFETIDVNSTPSYNNYPEANAVVLLREAKYAVKTIAKETYGITIDVPWSTFSEHVAIKVLREGGKRYADVKIPYWGDWELLDFNARTIKSNGVIIPVDTSDLYEITDFPEFVLYADKRAKVFTFPAVDTGCIVEYYYTVGYHEPYVPRWSFQFTEPECIARFSYDVPRFIGFDYRLSQVEDCSIAIEKEEQGKNNRVTFVARDVPPIVIESLSPPQDDISSWIMMSWCSMYIFFYEFSSGQNSWFEIGQNYSTVFDSIAEQGKFARKKAHEIVAECLTDSAKIVAIYRYIQDNFRYVAVDAEGHGIFPHDPDKVMSNQYGDCKDLSCLVISMLRAVGIEAYPILIKTKEAGKFIFDFPTLAQINHVATAISLKHFAGEKTLDRATVHGDDQVSRADDFVIVDPTAATIPLGQLHSGIESTKAILCAGLKSRTFTLPTMTFTDNIWNTCLIMVAGQDQFSGTLDIRTRGEEAAVLRYCLLRSSSSEIKEYLEQYLQFYPLSLHMDSFDLSYVREQDSALVIHVKYHSSSPLQRTHNQLFIPTMLKTIPQLQKLSQSTHRVHNVQFDYPQMHRDVTKIVIPAGYRVADLPERNNLKNDWCEFSFSVYIQGDTVVVNRNVAVKDCIVPKTYYNEIRTFATNVLDSGNRIIVVEKK